MEVPVHMIPGPTGAGPCGPLPLRPPLRYTLQPGPMHQTRHSVASTPFAGVAWSFPDARAPHDPVMVGMQHTDSLQ